MTRPQVVIFPGASLMEFRVLPDGLEVSCPGCQARQVFPLDAAGSAGFLHEADCPVHARIREAVERYSECVVRQG